MNLEQRINAFVRLGEFLSQFSVDGIQKNEKVLHNDLFFEEFKHQIQSAKNHSGRRYARFNQTKTYVLPRSEHGFPQCHLLLG